MGGHYEKDIYRQLQELMGRVDSMSKELKDSKKEFKWELKTQEINLKEEFRQERKQLTDKIEDLEQQLEIKDKEIRRLTDDNERMKSILNNDSSNTSQPPSTDQKGTRPANTFNGREKTGRTPGGQKGHKGTTLSKSDVEERIRSGRCRHEIRNIGDSSSRKYITKYVIDLKVEPVITEIRIYADKEGKFFIPPKYRSDVTYGENVKALSISLYSEGVMSNDRIAAFLNAAGNGELGLSEGSVYAFCRKFGANAEQSIRSLEEELLNQRVVATDATTVTVNGEQNYVRNFSTDRTVVYRAMKSKAIEALGKLRFLEKYAGILIHDHETALYHYGRDHGECNVHIIRYLRKNTEDTGNEWSKEMIRLLCRMNQARKASIDKGLKAFDEETVRGYEREYYALIKKGHEENEKTLHKYAKSDERTLLNRLEKYSRNHLLFLHDFEVSFDNNMSERDLRKVKNRQKMAGGFRRNSGHEMYCAILTIIETLKKREMGIIENVKKLFMGTPAIF